MDLVMDKTFYLRWLKKAKDISLDKMIAQFWLETI